jgi:Protein of unknown function (DUF2510)
VAEMVSAALGRPVVADAHPKHAIALGAAIAAAAAASGADTAATADATVLIEVTEEASLTRSAAAAEAVTGVAALPHPAAAGWEPDPTGRHDHRYFDGTAWTDDVADAGQASLDPLAEAVASATVNPVVSGPGTVTGTGGRAPAGAPPPPVGYTLPTVPAGPGGKGSATGAKRPNRRVLVVAAAVAVVALVGGTMAVLGGGSSGSDTGVGNFSGTIPAKGTFVHRVKASKGQVLLAKVLPQSTDLLPVLSVATDVQTIDKYKTTFSGTFSPPGAGAQAQKNFSQLSGVDLSKLDGGLLLVGSTNSPGDSEALALPVPVDGEFDLVVTLARPSATATASTDAPKGKVDLQVRLASFPQPVGLKDGGAAYKGLVQTAFKKFVDGDQDIAAVKDFSVSDIVDSSELDSDFSSFSDGFTDFSTDLSDAFTG